MQKHANQLEDLEIKTRSHKLKLESLGKEKLEKQGVIKVVKQVNIDYVTKDLLTEQIEDLVNQIERQSEILEKYGSNFENLDRDIKQVELLKQLTNKNGKKIEYILDSNQAQNKRNGETFSQLEKNIGNNSRRLGELISTVGTLTDNTCTKHAHCKLKEYVDGFANIDHVDKLKTYFLPKFEEFGNKIDYFLD